MINQQIEAGRALDTKIQQKVNAAHREAFREKFPGQIEHCLRLTAERLQSGLRKDQDQPLSNPEVADLALSLYHLYQIHRDIIDK